MDYESHADSINRARRARNEPEIAKDELIAMIKKSASDISSGQLDDDESRALAEFRRAEIDRRHKELEQTIRDTPLFIKIFWWSLFCAVIYGIYYFFKH